MSDAAPTPIRADPDRHTTPMRPRTDGGTKATQTDRLPDTEYVVYALVQAFKTFISIAAKRWPDIR